jgi:leader peptidase (prepilin peptidase)/N-methyltransferase
MMINLLYPKGMGGGDGVMAAGLGAWLGSERVLIMILIAFGLGALVSLPMILTGQLKRKSLIPFGPYLAFSSFVIWFFPHWVDSLEGWFFPNS